MDLNGIYITEVVKRTTTQLQSDADALGLQESFERTNISVAGPTIKIEWL